MRWKDQIVNGRVFELRSKSEKYPPPCALVIDETAKTWGGRMFEPVDGLGCIGDGQYQRRHNPNIYIRGLRFDWVNSSRFARRHRDLERFDADDLAMMRYGYGLALDFNGRIHGSHYGDMSIPVVVTSEWTTFWLHGFEWDDYRTYRPLDIRKDIEILMGGAWHFESRGGHRNLGYKFGHLWATRHTGSRLKQIREFLFAKFGSRCIFRMSSTSSLGGTY